MLRKVSILVFGLIVASLFFRCSDDFDKNDNGVMFGKKSHRQVHYLSGDKTQDVLKKFEIAASKSKKMKLFTKSGASQRSNVGTIDYSTIMQVIDTLGNINYTFKVINHPEDDENTFHNLVLKEYNEEEFKILLIKYQHFDANFKFNENTTFKSINLTSTEPCSNEPIPISGGGGGGGTYDPGIPNPGSGGSSGSGTYNPSDSPSCWETLYIRCCHNTEYHYGNNSSCTCPEGERDATIIYNTCDTTRPPTFIIGRNTNIDPCNPDGDVGVLVPQVFDDNCKELKKLLDNPVLKHALTDLDQAKGGTHEKGWAFKNFPTSENPASPTVMPQDPQNPHIVSISDFTGNRYFGYGHCHTDPEKGAIQMFGSMDIVPLSKLHHRYVPSGGVAKDPSLFFVGGTFTTGQYMLKIKDANKLALNINIAFNKGMEEELEDEYKKLKENNEELNISKLEIVFLKLLKKYDLGVGLFVANNDLTNWSEVTLNPTNENNTPVKTPCP